MRVLAYQGSEGYVYTVSGGFQQKKIAYSVLVTRGLPTSVLNVEDVFIQDDPFRVLPDHAPGENNVFHVKFTHDVTLPPSNIPSKTTKYADVAFFGKTNGVIPFVDPLNDLVLYEPAPEYEKHGLCDRILFARRGDRVIVSTLAIIREGSASWSTKYYLSCSARILDPCEGGCNVNHSHYASATYKISGLSEQLVENEWAKHLAQAWSTPRGTQRQSGSISIYSDFESSAFERLKNISFLKSIFGEEYIAELAEQAYKSCNFFDGNGIALLRDLSELRSSVDGFFNTIKGVPSRKAKAVASAYLAAHYGFRLTIADISQLKREIQRLRHTYDYSARSSCETVTNGMSVTHRFQMKYDPFSDILSPLDHITNILDLDLDLGNIWDLVPFSFVSDWFVDIGSALESIDNWANVQRTINHKVTITSRTCKGSIMIDCGNTQIAIPVEGYYRRIFTSLQTPSFSLTRNPLTQTCQSHWIEGTALLISKK